MHVNRPNINKQIDIKTERQIYFHLRIEINLYKDGLQKIDQIDVLSIKLIING